MSVLDNNKRKRNAESSTIKSLKLIVTLFLVSLTLSLFVISVSVIVYALPSNIGGGGGGSGSKAGSFGLQNSPSGFERPNNNGVPDNNFGGAFSGIERSPSPNNGRSSGALTNLSPSSNNGSPASLAGLQQQQQQQHQVNNPSNANHLVNTNECSSTVARPNSPNTKAVQPSNCSFPSPPNNTPQTNSGIVHTNNNNDNCAAVVHPNSPDTKVVGTNGCPTNTNTHVTVNSDGTTTSSSSSSLTVNNVQGSNDGSSSANINTIPIANAGPNQKVHSSDQVVLDGTKSSDPSGGNSLKFSWLQLAGGPAMALSNHDKSKATFVAPSVTGNTILTFQLIVNDGNYYSAPSYVTVTVQP